jgi:putative holliday junction resolvase
MNETSREKRILGIDYGSTRIGLSLSDPLQIIAQPYKTLANSKQTLKEICQIVDEREVGLIVVGMPFNLKGEKGKKAQEVDEFINRLREATTTEVVHWDERFTTSIAHQTLLDMGTRREERRSNKGRVDAMAAAILLQGFLDSRKRSLNC